MKKILLSLVMLFAVVSVNASVTTNTTTNVKIQSIDVEVKENISYNEELKIGYSISPRDAKNLKLTWDVTGIKKGITVEFVGSKNTTTADGEVVIKVNNTLDGEVTLTLRAKQNGKVLSSTKLVVESKEETKERIVTEIEELISSLDNEINNNNYEKNKQIVEEIESLLENNSEFKDIVDSDLLTQYEAISQTVNDYEVTNNKTFILIVSILLIFVFAALIYWIFKKED